MKNIKYAIFPYVLILLQSLFLSAQNHKFVDPLIGSEGPGNVFIGPSCPYGMIKPGPDNALNANSGYSPDLDKAIYGFSQVHVSGTGGGPKYGNVSVMPFSGDFESIKQESLRENEEVKLGYYSVLLNKWNVQTEITTSDRAAFYRFQFDSNNKNAIKIDLGRYLGESIVPDGREAQQFVGSQIEVISDTEVRGYTKIRGGWNNGSAYTVYFSVIFDQPFTSFSTWKDQKFYPNQKAQVDDGKKTGSMMFFEGLKDQKVAMKIGISFISSLKAKQNIDLEIPHWEFEKVLAETLENRPQFQRRRTDDNE